MRQMLVALSPSIGVSAEHLLSEYEQLILPGAHAAREQSRSSTAQEAPYKAASRLQIAFQHECA